MEILKGMVKDAGYPDVECTYGKVDDNTIYYFVNVLPNENVIASTVLKEAIGHAPNTSLGVITKEGDVLIPFEHKVIKQVKDELLFAEKNIPTTPSVVEAINSKADPAKAQKMAEDVEGIKSQMNEAMSLGGDFIFEDAYSEATLYTMNGVNVSGGYFSFISENNSNYFFATNVLNEQIVKFNPELLANNEQIEQPAELPQEENINATPQVDSQPTETPMPETNQEDTQATEENTSLDINFGFMNNQEAPQEEVPTQTETTTPEEVADNNVEEPQTEETQTEEVPSVEIATDTESVENNDENNQEEATPTEGIDLPSGEDTSGGSEESTQEEETPTEGIELPSGEDTSDSSEESTQEEETPTEGIELPSDEDTSDSSEEESTQEEETTDEIELPSDEDTSDASEEETSTEDSVNEEESDEKLESLSDDNEETENEEEATDETTEETKIDVNNNSREITYDDMSNPVIADATNTIKKLLNENSEQRQQIDRLSGEIMSIKTQYEIIYEENEVKEKEILSIRSELANARNVSTALTRENVKLGATINKNKEIIAALEDQNQKLRDQVAGLHALGNAVAEANVLIEPMDDDTEYGNLN